MWSNTQLRRIADGYREMCQRNTEILSLIKSYEILKVEQLVVLIVAPVTER